MCSKYSQTQPNLQIKPQRKCFLGNQISDGPGWDVLIAGELPPPPFSLRRARWQSP